MDGDDDDYRGRNYYGSNNNNNNYYGAVDEDEEDEDDNRRKSKSKTNGGGSATQQQPGAEAERLTVHSYGALDVTAVEDDCWLIRIPQTVAEIWEKLEEGTELGELIFTKGATGPTAPGVPTMSIRPQPSTPAKPSMTLDLKEDVVRHQLEKQYKKKHKKLLGAAVAAGTNAKLDIKMIPLHYSLQAMTKKVPVLHPFIRNPTTGRVTIMGTVSRTANLQVERNDNNYRAMIKDRLVSSMNVSKFVKPMEATEGIINKQGRKGGGGGAGGLSSTATSAIPGATRKNSFGEAVFQYGKRKLEALQDANVASSLDDGKNPASKKSNRLQFAPDMPLRSVLFELFQHQPYWTIKDLKAAAVAGGALASTNTKRAEAEIREILREEIGEYHRSGDHKNKWELRKEFQQYSSNDFNPSLLQSSSSSNNNNNTSGSNGS